ncbi:3-deoxy-manno-octulosonate cytidylyltransferase [Aureimonas populi]|uniref:3-deoxy-manno-octulosonate cytidylyltransferase n=1 Tax=Aureimonas populi TaxID=1701758 RepID=A0ABW5CRT3_9HYPH|nr:3-deoxy-manno-octulosonate cytidylyltransferase [Aureimonas populi]
MAEPTSFEGMETVEEAVAFFERYETIVLVANSDVIDIGALRGAYSGDTLFVFFNKVYKVLSKPFEGEAVLVARSSPAGANIVYRREVDDVLRLLRGPRFQGVLNLKAGPQEVLSPAGEFGGVQVAHVDLAGTMEGFYPVTHVPTSGFALALLLSERCMGSRIVLAGFTARRSAKWKLFYDHDWTFEQIVLRLLFRSGRLEPAPGAARVEGALDAIARRLPGVTAEDVSLVAGDVLSERLESAHMGIDALMKVTRVQQRFDGWVRALKPRTRKEKRAAEPCQGR